MRFEWDEDKNAGNIEKHGFDFMQAERIFSGPAPIVIDADVREDYEEERWICIWNDRGHRGCCGVHSSSAGCSPHPFSSKGE